MWNLDYFVLNDDNKRDPKELFKEIYEKSKEEKIKKEENQQKTAPSEGLTPKSENLIKTP